jgi:hypothetical protein
VHNSFFIVFISCEGVLFSSGVFRLHRCFFKYPILREGVYPAGDFRRVEMVNWTALLGLEQGVKVRHTSRSWIVHVETCMVAVLVSCLLCRRILLIALLKI